MKINNLIISMFIVVILSFAAQSQTIKSENELYMLSGHITNNCTGNALPAVSVVATGIQQYTTETDDNGYYELMMDNGTYDIEIIKNGYDTSRVLNLPVVSNIQIDTQLTAIYYAPINVVATVNESETICYFTWEMPFNKNFANKDLINFRVAIVSYFSPCNDPSSGILTPISGVDNSYDVTDWSSGYYAFAVKAIYSCGESEWSYSNTFSVKLGNEILLSVDLCNSSSPDSTIVTLFGKDCPWKVYDTSADSVGNIIFGNITEGHYDINIAHNGYSTINYNSVPLFADTVMSTSLTQNMLPPQNMYVDSTTNTAYWEKPVVTSDSSKVKMYYIFLDNLLMDTTNSEIKSYTFSGLNYNQTYNTCIEAVYDCGSSEKVCYTWKSQLLSINENSQNKSIVIYPNPAKDVITIESVVLLKQISIINSFGKEVYNVDVNKETQAVINTNNYKSGLYIVKITTETGLINKNLIISK